jgi:hypothetical protein
MTRASYFLFGYAAYFLVSAGWSAWLAIPVFLAVTLVALVLQDGVIGVSSTGVADGWVGAFENLVTVVALALFPVAVWQTLLRGELLWFLVLIPVLVLLSFISILPLGMWAAGLLVALRLRAALFRAVELGDEAWVKEIYDEMRRGSVLPGRRINADAALERARALQRAKSRRNPQQRPTDEDREFLRDMLRQELAHMLFLEELGGIRSIVENMQRQGIDWKQEYRVAAQQYDETWVAREHHRRTAPPETLVDPDVKWPERPPRPDLPFSR